MKMKKASNRKPTCREDQLPASAQLLLNALRELIAKTGQNAFTDDEILTYINTVMWTDPNWADLVARCKMET